MANDKPKHINSFLDFMNRHGSTTPDIVIPCSDGELVILSGIDLEEYLQETSDEEGYDN